MTLTQSRLEGAYYHSSTDERGYQTTVRRGSSSDADYYGDAKSRLAKFKKCAVSDYSGMFYLASTIMPKA